ncbi:MAG: phenylalanine--tRNA ligase subunit alpha [Actinomycetota bacterium]
MTEAPDLRARFEAAREEGTRIIESAADLDALEEARVKIMGRKAPLSQARASLGKLPENERRDLGRLANEVYSALESAFEAKRERFASAATEQRWDEERLDVTLPGSELPAGAIHPLTRTIWQIVDVFIGLGYRVADGPEIELTRYLFDALNMPQHHPARSPLDTFFIEGGGDDVVVRTETSAVQIRTMEAQEPPVYVVIPGRVYRRDAEDATHTSGFTQIEGLAVDEGITMADLKGTLEVFAHEIFGKGLDVRFRPSFFPFTEPSAEMDVQCFACRGAGCRVCKGEGWIEILGCGLVDPFLLEWVSYDPEQYSGFAFGMGVERIAALANGVMDIRQFFTNDLRFLARIGSRT